MSSSTQQYIGRFAPSPSGPLHFGSIIAALGSYLDAKYHKGEWLVRIDDIDTPRVQTGASDEILFSLDSLGLHWDGNILYQSQRNDAYREAEDLLQSKDLLYRCYCPRKLVRGKPYPGTCRQIRKPVDKQYAIRVKTRPGICCLPDLIQGQYSQNLSRDVGDFIIKRSVGLYAYHLAVAVDDAYQHITHVVRGADLLDSTPRQIYLQQELDLVTPIYAHFPVAVNQSGEKISKQNKAENVMLQNRPANILYQCLEFLGQEPEPVLLQASVDEVLNWGIANWKLSKIPGVASIDTADKFQLLH
jgi:glutamyl-Q tRNA(Asp) synthetase